ncbi:hypothetical protein [Marinobacter sp. NFXS9]|uniref:hypothetical protein n=1 Tax=Marinobacter sp. NFXS9 TaxID=2818433 RepID=UPI0032DF8951
MPEHQNATADRPIHQIDVIDRATTQLYALTDMLSLYLDNQKPGDDSLSCESLSNYVWQMQENIENIDAAAKQL